MHITVSQISPAHVLIKGRLPSPEVPAVKKETWMYSIICEGMLKEIHNAAMTKTIFRHCKRALSKLTSCQNFVRKSQLALFEGKLQAFLTDLTFCSGPVIGLIKTN